MTVEIGSGYLTDWSVSLENDVKKGIAMKVERMADALGGVFRVSQKGVPHVVIHGENMAFSVAFFGKKQCWRVFTNYGKHGKGVKKERHDIHARGAAQTATAIKQKIQELDKDTHKERLAMAMERTDVNALRETEGARVVSPADGVVLHDYDLRPATITLGQHLSANGTAGKYFRQDDESEHDSLLVTPIRVQATQTYWGDGGFDRDRTPLCYSSNGVTAALMTADGSPTRYPGQRCAVCPKFTAQPWKQTARGGYCSPGYFVLFMNVESFELMAMRLNGASAKYGRILAGQGMLRKAAVRLGIREVTNDTGKFFQMTATAERLLTPDEVEVLEGLAGDAFTVEATEVDTPKANAPQQEPTQQALAAEPPDYTPAEPDELQDAPDGADEVEIDPDNMPW